MKHVSWMRTTIRSTAVLAWVLALAAGQANAQPEKKRPAGPPPDHVLKGPHVEDNSVPGQRGRFAGGRPDQRGQQGQDPRQMVRAIGVLRGESTPAADRLTPEQERQLDAIQDGAREKMRAFAEAHREEITQLRSQLGPQARRQVDQRLRSMPGLMGPEGRPRDDQDQQRGRPARRAGGDEMSPDTDAAGEKAAMERLRAIAEMAPDMRDSQTKAWGVLSASQKAIVEKEIARQRSENASRPEGGPRGGPRIPPEAIRPDGSVDLSKLPQGMRERLERLTPEEREQALKRLAERPADGGQRRGGERGAKPGDTSGRK